MKEDKETSRTSSRRQFLKNLTATGAALAVSGALADEALAQFSATRIKKPPAGAPELNKAMLEARSGNLEAAINAAGQGPAQRLAVLTEGQVASNAPNLKNVGEAVGGYIEFLASLPPEQRKAAIAGGFFCGSGCGKGCSVQSGAEGGIGCGSGCGTGCKGSQAANGIVCGSGCGSGCETMSTAIGTLCGYGCAGFPPGHVLVIDAAGEYFKQATQGQAFSNVNAAEFGASLRRAALAAG